MKPISGDWSDEEVSLCVRRYFEYWLSDPKGRPSKAALYRMMAEELPGRTKKAVERKFSNISATLDGAGYPYMRGVTPLENAQNKLRIAVLLHLHAHPIPRRADIGG